MSKGAGRRFGHSPLLVLGLLCLASIAGCLQLPDSCHSGDLSCHPDLALLLRGWPSAPIARLPSEVQAEKLKLWLKADALTLNDADPVASWSDSSGTGNDVAQGTPASRPTFRTNAVNGRPVLRFDGTDDTMSDTSPTGITGLASAFTIFLVVRRPSVPSSGFGAVLAVGAPAMNQLVCELESSTASGTGAPATSFSCLVGGVGNLGATMTHFTDTTRFYLIGFDRSNTAPDRFAHYFVDGTMESGYFAGSNILAGTEVHVGSSGGAQFLPVDIAELIYYDSVILSTSERHAIDCHLSSKYAIALGHSC